MKQDNTINRLNDTLNRIILTVYRYFRKKPSTRIDYVTYWGAGGDLGISKRLPAWKKVIETDKIIDAFIVETGITHFQTRSLYNLNESDLYECFIAARFGFIKPDDFSFADPVSKVFDLDDLNYWERRMPVKYFMKQLNNPLVLDAARKGSSTEEEFDSIKTKLASYLASIDASRASTLRIQRVISQGGISSYLGQSLYDIDNEKLLDEAVSAIITMQDLLSVGVCAYKGQHLTKLSNFILERVSIEYDADDFTNIEFDNVARAKYLQIMEETAKEEERTKAIEAERKKKRNEAARKRRESNKKDVVKRYAPAPKKESAKAPVKSKAAPGVKKAKESSKMKAPHTKKPEAPVKKIQPAKAAKKKAS